MGLAGTAACTDIHCVSCSSRSWVARSVGSGGGRPWTAVRPGGLGGVTAVSCLLLGDRGLPREARPAATGALARRPGVGGIIEPPSAYPRSDALYSDLCTWLLPSPHHLLAGSNWLVRRFCRARQPPRAPAVSASVCRRPSLGTRTIVAVVVAAAIVVVRLVLVHGIIILFVFV
jgi:hypothetical protein